MKQPQPFPRLHSELSTICAYLPSLYGSTPCHLQGEYSWEIAITCSPCKSNWFILCTECCGVASSHHWIVDLNHRAKHNQFLHKTGTGRGQKCKSLNTEDDESSGWSGLPDFDSVDAEPTPVSFSDRALMSVMAALIQANQFGSASSVSFFSGQINSVSGVMQLILWCSCFYTPAVLFWCIHPITPVWFH